MSKVWAPASRKRLISTVSFQAGRTTGSAVPPRQDTPLADHIRQFVWGVPGVAPAPVESRRGDHLQRGAAAQRAPQPHLAIYCPDCALEGVGLYYHGFPSGMSLMDAW